MQLIRPVFGEERFERFMQALDEESPVSIRLNPKRMKDTSKSNHNYPLSILYSQLKEVPWCRNGYYLKQRPNFTFDPLLHAGCYYVQEASSMFLDEVLRQHLPSLTAGKGLQTIDNRPLAGLDLCAAPGGKSTLLRAALPEDSVLYSNEPNRKRASILLENVTKWGYKNHYVTNLYPKDYRKAKMKFDLILCDVPCSGEGMFRKDPDTIKEWSPQNVMKCQQLQREIVSDAWECLNDGGLLIYSTCTYNIHEDEENVRWIIDELGAEALLVETKPEWGITGSLLEGFDKPVYRFIPGYTRGEGLFMAVLRKPGEPSGNSRYQKDYHSLVTMLPQCGNNITTGRYHHYHSAVTTLPQNGNDVTTMGTPRVDVDYSLAIAYLRGEAITLPPDTPRGLVTVSFMGQPLGQAKNIGNRANNLYPKEWRIKSTHVPPTYEPLFCFTQ